LCFNLDVFLKVLNKYFYGEKYRRTEELLT
jgi:hypothetical protein